MTELAAQLDEPGIDLVVLEPGTDTRLLFHGIAAMDEMTADLISEAPARNRPHQCGRVGGDRRS